MAFSTEEEETIESLKRWWKENGSSLLIAVVVVFGGYFGWNAYQSSQQATAAAASDLYEQLGNAVIVAPGTQLSDAARSEANMVIGQLKSEYSDTIYASYAALFAARLAVEADDLSTAEAELQWLIDNAPSGDEALIRTATSRLARVVLAQGDADRALGILDSVDAGVFAAEFAELRGDIYVAMGQTTQAEASYQEAVEAGSTSATLQMKLDDVLLGS
ncbi:MAG: tetratricopeptide repeat protein [Pseudohongiellaceae bacterium]|nr:tetratricopeptide repeat protein [Pseudohongiellaceae bacterium]